MTLTNVRIMTEFEILLGLPKSNKDTKWADAVGKMMLTEWE